jgi:tRNA-specific 2-thiouridylase
MKDTFTVDQVNWVSIKKLDKEMSASVKIRYKHDGAEAVIYPLEHNRVRVELKQPQRAITPGQAAVFYDGDIVIGGGWIERN